MSLWIFCLYGTGKSSRIGQIFKIFFLSQPWDDETDMDAMLKAVKSVEMEGLVSGASKLVPVGKLCYRYCNGTGTAPYY